MCRFSRYIRARDRRSLREFFRTRPSGSLQKFAAFPLRDTVSRFEAQFLQTLPILRLHLRIAYLYLLYDVKLLFGSRTRLTAAKKGGKLGNEVGYGRGRNDRVNREAIGERTKGDEKRKGERVWGYVEGNTGRGV